MSSSISATSASFVVKILMIYRNSLYKKIGAKAQDYGDLIAQKVNEVGLTLDTMYSLRSKKEMCLNIITLWDYGNYLGIRNEDESGFSIQGLGCDLDDFYGMFGVCSNRMR